MHESNEQLFMDSVGTIELTQEEKATVDCCVAGLLTR